MRRRTFLQVAAVALTPIGDWPKVELDTKESALQEAPMHPPTTARPKE